MTREQIYNNNARVEIAFQALATFFNTNERDVADYDFKRESVKIDDHMNIERVIITPKKDDAIYFASARTYMRIADALGLLFFIAERTIIDNGEARKVPALLIHQDSWIIADDDESNE